MNGRVVRVRKFAEMNYYAHTAEDEHGKPLADEHRWQLLKDHLRAASESFARL